MEWVARRGRRADGKEQARRIPAGGCNEQAMQPAVFCLASSRVALILALACAARLAEIPTDIGAAHHALASTKIRSDAAHSSYSIVFWEIRYE